MKTERFAMITPAVALADDEPMLTAVWQDECRRHGGEPVGAPTWELVEDLAEFRALFPEYPHAILKIEGDAIKQ